MYISQYSLSGYQTTIDLMSVKFWIQDMSQILSRATVALFFSEICVFRVSHFFMFDSCLVDAWDARNGRFRLNRKLGYNALVFGSTYKQRIGGFDIILTLFWVDIFHYEQCFFCCEFSSVIICFSFFNSIKNTRVLSSQCGLITSVKWNSKPG